MNESSRGVIEGWVEKAGNQLQTAKDHLNSRICWSEAIEAAQESIELSVKSVLSLLDLEFPRTHGWNRKDLEAIAEQIQKRGLLRKIKSQNLYWTTRLPRLLLLANFWATFYLSAKYGFEAGMLASARDLFEEQEAALAVKHAEECHRAASELRYLPEENLAAISR